jgi:predicted transcriptional regulator
MSVRLSLLLSNELNAQIERAVTARDSTKAEVLRKAIAMYLVAVDGKQRGLRIGLACEDQALETEFVGL